MKLNLPCLLLFALIMSLTSLSKANEDRTSPSAPISKPGKITLEDYLSQVKINNLGVKGSILSSEGSLKRSEEGQLLLSTNAFIDLKAGSDAKLNPFSMIAWDRLNSETLSVGVSKQTKFGLLTKVHYDLTQSYIINLVGSSQQVPAPFFSSYPTTYTNASPVLEFTQNFWNNGFGRSTQATQDLQEAQALASSYTASFQAKLAISQAEISYWNLATARQVLAMYQEALERAKLIYQWNVKRAQLQLGDQSEVLQSEALVKGRELDVLTSQNNVRSASRNFNASRYIDSDEVKEELIELTPSMMAQIQTPTRAAQRDDVKAAEQQARASEAGAITSIEKSKPNLDLNASFALNGQVGNIPAGDLGTAMSNSLTFNRPTINVGLRLQVPLDFEITKRTTDGWKLEKIAAEKYYDQKVFSQEQDWKNLNESFNEAKMRLDLSITLENVQSAKLKAERDRLSRGRTTTYQVLLFEQDYLTSQIVRVRDQAIILNLIAQMKQYGESL